MKVHLIKRQSIEGYVRRNSQSKVPFGIWLSIIKRAEWNEPQNIINTFNSADILAKDSKRVVFNIGGNKYRMICKYHFGEVRVHLFVKWIGTHAAYTKLCNEGKQYTVNIY
ncbi:MAG: type II toxin-antitoxin system HigB family toxin [Bacteroidales bacterium]|jgi:mRNA interferase HigB|nr:type II toxin-antitoxin system HigB family toxin [Bacteroidales bacterium]